MTADPGSDKGLEEKAAARLREMLARKPLLARLEPVMVELSWVVAGRPGADQHQKILPEYCYQIFELYRRTLLKVLAPLSEVVAVKDPERAASCASTQEAKQAVAIDWEKLGAVIGMGERSLMFVGGELEGKIQEAGLSDLTAEQEAKAGKMLFGEEPVVENPGESQALEGQALAVAERLEKGVAEWHQKAVGWGPEAVSPFHAGVAKGAAGFLDQSGQLEGERKIKLPRTYELLLIAWPEIADMLAARPPKTRNDLWEWLTPFSLRRLDRDRRTWSNSTGCAPPLSCGSKSPAPPARPNNCAGFFRDRIVLPRPPC